MSRTTVRVLDWCVLGAIVVALTLAIFGGGTLRLGALRLSARGGERAAIVALLLFAVRLVIDRRTRLFDGPRAALTRFYDREGNAATPASSESLRLARVLAAIGLTIFGGVLLYPQILQMHGLPDLGDPLFSVWRLGWVHHKLSGDPSPLFSPNIYYPQPQTLAYSDAMLLPALTTAPLLALGVHPVVAYNVILLCSFVLTAWTMYLLVERLTGSPAAAFVSGLLFGYYPYRFEHYSHFELLMTYLMPLGLLVLHRFLETERLRYAVLFGLLAAGQLYSSMYYGVFFGVYSACLFVTLCALVTGDAGRRLRGAASGAVVIVVLAWPLMRSYQAAELGDRPATQVARYSAVIGDFAVPSINSATWAQRFPRDKAFDERTLFPGITILVLAAIGLWPRLGRLRIAYGVALAVALGMALGANTAPYRAAYDLMPFLRAIRSPARAAMLVGMTLSVLAGFGVQRLLAGRSREVTAALIGAIVVVAAIDLRPAIQPIEVWRTPPTIYQKLPGDRQVVLAEFPMGMDVRALWVDTPHMYFSLWHWAKLVNGYSGHAPHGYGHFQVAMLAFPDDGTMAELRGRGVTHVTVNCALFWKECDTLIAQIDQRRDLRLVASEVWQKQPVRLYEVVAEVPPTELASPRPTTEH